jgi:CheY-like chemotaxis protein
VTNAIKFTSQGRVKIDYKLKTGVLEFCVEDTGIGIAPEQQPRIFDRFYQVQSAISRTYEGTGLGLAISKAYVELLGGSIRVLSQPDRGSSFFFTIPYDRKIVEEVPAEKTPSDQKLSFSVRKKILVAEDIESNFKLIRYFLAGSNVEVLRAINGQEAVDLCRADNSIDLILMDIKMPVMDGYTAAKIIREFNPKVPIIAQTAYADDKMKAISSGCSGFLSKPFDKFGLMRVISEFI